MKPAAVLTERRSGLTDPRLLVARSNLSTGFVLCPCIEARSNQGSASSEDGNKLRCDARSKPTKIKGKVFKFYFDISYIVLDNRIVKCYYKFNLMKGKIYDY